MPLDLDDCGSGTPFSAGPRNHRYKMTIAALTGGVVVCGKRHQIRHLRDNVRLRAVCTVRMYRHALDKPCLYLRRFAVDQLVVKRVGHGDLILQPAFPDRRASARFSDQGVRADGRTR